MPTNTARTSARPKRLPPVREFDLDTRLDAARVARTLTQYAPSAVIFSQGDAATDVFYLQHGSVQVNGRGHGYLWVPSTADWSDLNNRLGRRQPVANGRLRHRRIGYARVSKADGSQSLDLQRDALWAAGVE